MSFKSKAAEGKLKKSDLYRCRYSDLKIEQGFNLRDMGSPDTQAHVQSIFSTINSGGTVPPLEVREDANGDIVVVDGHCRHAAYGLAIASGMAIEYINILPFRGNDADRVTKMITSSQGLALTVLESALGYKRLVGFNWQVPQIAASVGKSETYINQLLLLAYANSDVQEFVRSGAIAAHAAIEIVKKHGDQAGSVIASQVDTAKAQGKTRVTKAVVVGRAVPKRLSLGLIERVDSFTSRLPGDVLRTLAQFEGKSGEEIGGATVAVGVAELLDLLESKRQIDEAKAKQAAKIQAKEQAAKQQDLEV